MLRFKTINLIFGIVLILIVLLDYFFNLSSWIYGLMGVLWITLTTVGAFHIRWNYHLKAIHQNKGIKDNWVAITFDDGPHPEFTPKILKLLQMHDAKATFFCVGKQLEQNGELTEEIVTQGHTLGNHTYSHANDFGFFGTEKVITELKQTKEIIKAMTGLETRLYRPAFGVTNPNIKKAVHHLSLQTIGWSIRSLDTTNLSTKKVLHRITRKLNKGDIILLHDTSEKTVEVLEQLLLFLQKNNMRSVTVNQLLDLEAYA
ncbi:polysaccharide deacetylase family protein [Arenibacter sp. H213]|nr:polysaccharide deacetylase family protein [Arenibacter sp. H213]MCM4169026.1 polysaccharide deacetylase family protein [Arenibacter sp. H213]